MVAAVVAVAAAVVVVVVVTTDTAPHRVGEVGGAVRERNSRDQGILRVL